MKDLYLNEYVYLILTPIDYNVKNIEVWRVPKNPIFIESEIGGEWGIGYDKKIYFKWEDTFLKVKDRIKQEIAARRHTVVNELQELNALEYSPICLVDKIEEVTE